MLSVLQNSIFCRTVMACGRFLWRIWPSSLLARLIRAFQESYENSFLKRVWEGFWHMDDPAKTSLYGRFLAAVRGLLGRAAPVVRESVLYKLLCKLNIKKIIFCVFAAYLPIEYILRDVLGLGLASYWEELLIIGTAAFVFLRACADDDGGALKRSSSVEAALLLFMAVGLLLMVITMPYPYIAVAGYRAQVEYMVWFFLILRLLDSREDAKFLLKAFAGVVFLLTLHGIYQYIIAVPVPAGWISASEVGVRTRVFSITGSPNVFGSLLVLAAPLFASMIYYLEKPWHKFAALCLTGLVCLCDLFTFSKASWLGLAAAVVLFAVFVDKRLIGLMAAGIAALFVAFPSVTNRITYLFTSDYAERSAAAGRVMRWNAGLRLLTPANKWTGFGLGRFGGAVAMNNQVLEQTTYFKYFYMDNYYLKTMVEMGYIGIIFFALLLIVLMVNGLRAPNRAGTGYRVDRTKDPLFRNAGNDKLICVGILCGLLAVLTHCFYENIFEEPYMMTYFWGLAACLVYFGYFADKQKTDN